MTLYGDFAKSSALLSYCQALSASALKNLLRVSCEEVNDRLDMLQSILVVPESSTAPVRLLHLSFREFLLDPRQRDSNPFWVDEKQTHRQLAIRCLAILKDYLHMNICGLRAPATLRTTGNFHEVNSRLPPEVQYACLHWAYHIYQAGPASGLVGDVYDFFVCHFLHWLEVLSLMGKAYESLAMLENLRTDSAVCRHYSIVKRS